MSKQENPEALAEETQTSKDSSIPGLSQNEIDTWKSQFGRLRKIRIAGQDYIYRGLRRREWRMMLETMDKERAATQKVGGFEDPQYAASKVAAAATLFPKDFSNNSESYPAGTISVLSESILELSGFVPESDPEDL